MVSILASSKEFLDYSRVSNELLLEDSTYTVCVDVQRADRGLLASVEGSGGVGRVGDEGIERVCHLTIKAIRYGY